MRFLLITDNDTADKWRVMIRASLDEEITIDRQPKDSVRTFDDILEIFQQRYDVIMFPLTLPDYNSIRIAELAHRIDSKTRLILCSGTFGAPGPLEALFDSFIWSGEISVQSIRSSLEKPLTRNTEDLALAIRDVLEGGYLMEWKDPYKKYTSAHELLHDPVIRAQTRWAMRRPFNASLREGAGGEKVITSRSQVFISYAREDLDAARFIADRLKREGFDVWIDIESLMPGQDWQSEIEAAIRKASAVIILLSHAALQKRGYVQAEVEQALEILGQRPDGEVFVIPVRLDDCEPTNRRLRRIQQLNMQGDPESAMQELITTLKTVLGV